MEGDVSDPAMGLALVQAAVAAFGKVDVLASNMARYVTGAALMDGGMFVNLQ